MQAIARVQLNLFIQPLTGMPDVDNPGQNITWFEFLRPTYYPIYWIAEGGGISDSDAANFATSVYGAMFLVDLTYYGGFSIGVPAIMFGTFALLWTLFRMRRLRQKSKPSAKPTESTKLLGSSKAPISKQARSKPAATAAIVHSDEASAEAVAPIHPPDEDKNGVEGKAGAEGDGEGDQDNHGAAAAADASPVAETVEARSSV